MQLFWNSRAYQQSQTLGIGALDNNNNNNNNNNNHSNNKGSRGMGEVAPFYGVDSALVLTNPGVQ